jgi:Domain of unknown function (DUF222)/HNH endonuclease
MKSPGCTPSSDAFKGAHFAQVHQRRQHIEHLEDQITELAAHIHAATFRLLELVREYDECEGWGGKGLISCAHWLNWKCGIDLGTAREKVRVAHALKELPQISEEFRLGRFSYSKVRAMTRVATPKNEYYLLMISRYGTAVHVERLVRNYRKVKRIEALELENTRHAQRELNWFVDDDGYWVIRGRLTSEQGALVQKVLEQAMEQDFREQRGIPAGTSSTQPLDEINQQPEPISLRRADALVRMAQGYSGQSDSSSGDRFTVHVHTDMETLRANGLNGQAELEDGGTMSAETARRVSCDAGLVHWLENAEGEPLNIGRKSRTIPPAIGRALKRRDGGCRFPGCTNSHFVDAHHIRHWADGGETSMENLVLLCRHHHRLVHEGGFGLGKSLHGVIEFSTPAGEIILTGPPKNSRGNAWSLFEQHSESGIQITPKTAQSLWLGEKMDDDLAVLGMLQLEQRSENPLLSIFGFNPRPFT